MVECQPRLKGFLAALGLLGTRMCKCVCDCPEGATALPMHMPNNVTPPPSGYVHFREHVLGKMNLYILWLLW